MAAAIECRDGPSWIRKAWPFAGPAVVTGKEHERPLLEAAGPQGREDGPARLRPQTEPETQLVVQRTPFQTSESIGGVATPRCR